MSRDTGLTNGVFLDQENDVDIKPVAKQIDENSQTNLKKKHRISRQPSGRIPLGGKDENKVIPTLSRSQTSIDPSHNVFKRVPLQSKPKMSKSSSSLGFSHSASHLKTKPLGTGLRKFEEPVAVLPQEVPQTHKSIQDDPRLFQVDPQSKISHTDSTIFNPELANRGPSLEDYSIDTDSLKKKILHRGPAVSDLNETFTPETDTLNSINVPSRQIHNVDPVKSAKGPGTLQDRLAKYLSEPERARLFEELVNDANSIETKPPGPQTPLDQAIGSPEEILDYFKDSLGHHRSSSDINNKIDEIKLDDSFDMEFNERMSDEGSDIEQPVGLTERDLNNLLDF